MKRIIWGLVALISLIWSENPIKVLAVNDHNSSYEIELVDTAINENINVSLDLNGSRQVLSATDDRSTIIYFLIDSSIPMKSAFERGIKGLLKVNMPNFEKKYEQIIISTFDKNLKHIYNSKTDSNFLKRLNTIKITGQTTELWRNTMDTLKEIKEIDNQRKILVLVSDGDAEDTPAYTSAEVISFAKENNIRIASLAYRDKDTLVQNLRKVSDETYGKVWIADKRSHQLPKDFFDNFYLFINSHFVVDIPKSLLIPTLSGEQEIQINIAGQDINESVNVTLKTKKVIPTKTFWEEYKLYILIAAAVILVLLLVWALKPKKEEIIEEEIVEEDTIIAEPFVPEPTPVAFLESMGGTKHKIFKFPSTIGKKEGNDVIIDGQYISRNHAVIDLKDGMFYITDTNSANGTSVNGKKVEGTVQIQPDDKVSFGPYQTIFTLN